MKRYLFFALISCGLVNAQQGEPFRMGTFGDFSAHLGYDLSNLIRDDEKAFDDDGNFGYGFSAQVGYQLWQSFAFSGGLRYTFVEPKNIIRFKLLFSLIGFLINLKKGMIYLIFL